MMQRRKLKRLVQSLEHMFWQTAISGHVCQIVRLEPLRLAPVHVCRNGLLP